VRISMMAVAVSAALSGSALAGYTNIYTTNDLADWRDLGGLGIDASTSVFDPALVTSEHIETFSSFTPGDYASISNGNGEDHWWSWSINAPDVTGGSVRVQTNGGDTGVYVTPLAQSMTINFDGWAGLPGDDGFVSGLRGVGGGFSFFDANGNRANGRMTLKLSDGSSILRNFNAPDAFAGFWLTDPTLTITSLRLEAFGAGNGQKFVGATTLYLGYAGGPGSPIPAPGAVALLAAAGLIGSSRRR